jgi:hypothetical protein
MIFSVGEPLLLWINIVREKSVKATIRETSTSFSRKKTFIAHGVAHKGFHKVIYGFVHELYMPVERDRDFGSYK